MTNEHRIDVVHVVIPARDEEAYLPRALASLEAAMAAVPSPLSVRATVVLDLCTDASLSVVSRFPWVDAVSVSCGVVGRVRSLGVDRARDGATDPGAVWIACTDADTVVPPSWLVEQLVLAAQGRELVVGTVRPDSVDLPPDVLAAWESRHELGEGHTHVHGANMGFTLAAYDRVGGFEPVSSGEDVRLVARLQRAGVVWSATARTQVVTSGRRVGRVADGFSSYLLELTP
ncbi:MAG: glycosyl transferase [Marmoricola sp.]|nr:glycosyl transferase [Marmoricola sp.]